MLGGDACMEPLVLILHIQVYSPLFYVKGRHSNLRQNFHFQEETKAKLQTAF